MNIKIQAQLLELVSKEVLHILFFLGLWYALRSSPIIGNYSVGCPKMQQLLKCCAPWAFSGAKFHK